MFSRTCWAWYQTCKGGLATPGADQILCGPSNSYQWCCANDEFCTETIGQINICISSFQSPNKGLSAAEAQQREFSALPSSMIGSTIPTVTPTAFTTITFSMSTTSSTSNVSNSSSSSSEIVGTSNSSLPQSSSTGRMSNGELTSSSIAGIVGGIAASIVAVSGIVVILIWKKRRREAKESRAAASFKWPGEPHNRDEHWENDDRNYRRQRIVHVVEEQPQEVSAAIETLELPG